MDTLNDIALDAEKYAMVSCIAVGLLNQSYEQNHLPRSCLAY